MVSIGKFANNCARFESNTEVTIRFEISNICTALISTSHFEQLNNYHFVRPVEYYSVSDASSIICSASFLDFIHDACLLQLIVFCCQDFDCKALHAQCKTCQLHLVKL